MSYIYMIECYSDMKNEWNLTICDNTDGPREFCVEWNKSDKDKYHMISLNVETKKQNKLKQKTDS